MAVAASNKSSSKPGLSYPDLEEQALQFILDCCEPNIEKYTKYLEVMSFPWHLLHSTTSHKILTICYLINFLILSSFDECFCTQITVISF